MNSQQDVIYGLMNELEEALDKGFPFLKNFLSPYINENTVADRGRISAIHIHIRSTLSKFLSPFNGNFLTCKSFFR